MKKRILLLEIICIVILNQFFVSTSVRAENSTFSSQTDIVYENALSLLCNLDLIPENQKVSASTVTREEFAYYLGYMYGVVNGLETSDDTSNNKYNGYSNEVVTDDWLWEADKPHDEVVHEVKETGTPFYDVASDNIYFEGIKFAAQIGFMTGSDGYFRPGERLTGCEMVKVAVNMLNATFKVKGGYPAGYLTLANTLGITDGLLSNDLNSFVTYRDLVVCLANTLETENYIVEDAINLKYTRNGLMLLENEFAIGCGEGIVNANSTTSLDSMLVTSEKTITVGDFKYFVEDTVYDSYLGYNVNVYYNKDGAQRNLIYMAKNYENNELYVASEDIVNYSSQHLNFYSENKVKKEYIGADTVIIRNGVLLDNYTVGDIIPTNGSIRFLSNDGDRKYEVVFIESIDVIWVNYIDAENKVFYDKLTNKPIDMSGKENVYAFDVNGNSVELEDIKANAVLELRNTLEKQNPKNANMTVVYKSINGIATEIDKGQKLIKIGDKNYELSSWCLTNELKLGNSYVFYLDSNYKIVAWIDENTSFRNGYLVNASVSSGIRQNVYARLYDFTDKEFVTYEFNEKVNFKESKQSPSQIIYSSSVYDSAKNKITAQVIKYKLNSENKIIDFITEDEFKLLYNGSSKLTYRTIPGAFMTTRPAFYANPDVVYINVPTGDTTNEELYYTTKIVQDGDYKPSVAYTDDPDSMIATVVVEKKEDISVSTNLSNETDPVFIIVGIRNSLDKNGEDAYKLVCQGVSGKVEIYVKKSNKFENVGSYKPGDIIRASYYDNTMMVTAIERLFDCTNMIFDDESAYWSDTYPNPFLSSSDEHFVAGFGLVHGTPLKRYDNGELINVGMYSYSRDNNNELVVNRTDIKETVNLKGRSFAVYEFDRERNQLKQVPFDSSVYDAETAGDLSSEIIAYSRWGEPRIIFIYK